MATLVRSARYMGQFRCLGGDCEDTCCQGWTVLVDEVNHRRLTVLAADRPIVAKLLREGIELTPEGPSFARLRFAESGRCGMLDERGLCQVHAELGPSALTDVCATYPRYFNEVDGVLEQFGTLSCPEVARQCLMNDDPFAIEEAPLERPRKLRNQFTTEKPYFRPYLLLRAQFLAVLERSDYSLSEKLFMLLWSSSKLADIVHARALQLPMRDFEFALMGLFNDVALVNVSNNYRALTLDGSFALSVITSLLEEGDTTNWEDHICQRESLSVQAVERAQACVTRYCQNYLMTTPYMLSDNVFAYTRNLLRSAAALRVLLQRRLAGFRGDEAELSACLVEILYRFCRRLEHSDKFQKLDQSLEQQGLNSLAHTVGFLAI